MTARPIHTRTVAGFTLIELLVVVAIIALLISILLPSLGRARAQARTSLCASRISQLAKSLLIYSEDFNETPPFMGRGWENWDEVIGGDEWPAGSGITVEDWARWEDWLMPDMPDYWALPQDIWPNKARLRNGSLWSYARFENLYRCPDFERSGSGLKSQNVFNYARSVIARKWFLPGEPEDQSGPYVHSSDFGSPGPIAKLSTIHAPARGILLVDEDWRFHVAAPVGETSPPRDAPVAGGWMAEDCMAFVVGSDIGGYHGAEKQKAAPPFVGGVPVPPAKSGYIACYDGHAELSLDVLPGKNLDGNVFDLNPLPRDPEVRQFWYALDWLLGHIFSVRGKHVVF